MTSESSSARNRRILTGRPAPVRLDKLLDEAREVFESPECALVKRNIGKDSSLTISLLELPANKLDPKSALARLISPRSSLTISFLELPADKLDAKEEDRIYSVYVESSGVFIYQGRYMYREHAEQFAEGIGAILKSKKYRV